MASNVDMATRVFQLIREKEQLQAEVQNLRERFARLTPDAQRQAVNFEAMLLLVMVRHGRRTFTVTPEQMAAMPQDCTLLLDGGEDGKTLRIRVVNAADDEAHPERSN